MNKKLLMFLTAVMMTLTSCGGKGNTSTSTSSFGSKYSVNHDVDITGEKWNSELKAKMVEMFGENLPYIEMATDYQFTTFNSQGLNILYIYEQNSVDKGLTNDYKTLLDNEGKYFYGSDDTTEEGSFYYNYSKQISVDTDIILRFGYYLGETNYNPGFEIYAYISSPLVSVDEWSEEEKALLMEHIGETVPVPAFSNTHTTEWDSDLNAIVVKDYYVSTAGCEYYAELLLASSYTANTDLFGFTSYVKQSKQDPLYNIQIEIYDYNSYGQNGMEVYIKKVIGYNQVEGWPTEEINTYFDNKEDFKTIPEFTEGTSYKYNSNDQGFFIFINTTAGNASNYLTTLRLNGYYITTSNGTMIACNFKENVLIYIVYVSTSNELQLGIVENTKFSYLSIDKEFPTKYITQYVTSDTVVPAFDAPEYKSYYISSKGYLEIDAIDKDDSICASYKATLEEAGYTVSVNSDNGYNLYTATSLDGKVKIRFYSRYHYFVSAFSLNA